MEDETYAIKGDAIERKRAPVARQLARERRDSDGVAAGEDGTMSAPRRFARDQFAGVAVRAVEEPSHGTLCIHVQSSAGRQRQSAALIRAAITAYPSALG